jgi:N-acetylglucosaminyl-diphospho-decaprenol L-rhamnosyltransferase
MDLSVIIVSTDEAGFLRPCLCALRSGLTHLEVEVLVVDNACQDDTVRVAREAFPEATIVTAAVRGGFARSNNLAMCMATGRHLLLLNPDTEVRPGALAALVRYLDDHPQVGIAGARLLNPDGTLQHSCRTYPSIAASFSRWLPWCPEPVRRRAVSEYLMLTWDHATDDPVDWVIGACLCARQAAVAQVGMLDESFFLYYEDTDWCYRMWEQGWEVRYVPEAVVMHHYQRAGGRGLSGRATRIQVRSLARLFLKHGRRRPPRIPTTAPRAGAP